MNKCQIKAIVFDLGNVLIDFNHMIAARRIARFTEKTAQEIFALFFDSGITRLFEEGRISPSDFFKQVKIMLKSEISYKEFLPIWNEIFFISDRNLDVYNLAKKLKQKYTLALLSNINLLHFEYLKRKFAVFDVFDHLFLSYDLHLTKPDNLIYNKVLNSLFLQPQEIFYTDDRLELISAARKIGINSFQFTDPEQLKIDFASLGIEAG